MTKKVPPREFRPATPSINELLPTAFLFIILVAIAPGVISRPTTESIIGLIGLVGLIVGGVWLYLRDRWPGDPTLKVDARGLSYTRFESTKRMDWADLIANPVDFTLKRMTFVSVKGQRITTRHDMVTQDGTPWLMVIEDYWRAPSHRRRTARP